MKSEIRKTKVKKKYIARGACVAKKKNVSKIRLKNISPRSKGVKRNNGFEKESMKIEKDEKES